MSSARTRGNVRWQLFGWAFLACTAATPSALAQTSNAIGDTRIAVHTVMALRAVSAPREIAREQGRLHATADVVVDANTQYLLRVRLAHEPPTGVHVLVRDTAGVFQPLVGDDAVVVAVEQLRGRTSHTVSCRIEGRDAAAIQAGACALTYEWFTADGAMRILSASGL